MNLHGIVSGAVGSVNPPTAATIQRSTGYTTNADGSRVPTYAPAVTCFVQVQALQYNDIAQLDGLNIQGERRAVYLNGSWEGLVRADRKGGDLLTMPDGSVWLVAMVLEAWPDWTKLAVTRQTDGT